MKRLAHNCSVALVTALSLASCGPAPQPPAPKIEAAPAVAPAVTPLPTDAWLGDWIGVEGNTLKIENGGVPGAYTMSERTLDGPLSYTGIAQGAAISFEEKGKVKTIRAGTGDETGLKYLAGKTNCLVIEPSRGFCR